MRFVANRAGLKFGDRVLDVGELVPVGYEAAEMKALLNLGWVLPAGYVNAQETDTIPTSGSAPSETTQETETAQVVAYESLSRRELIGILNDKGVEVATYPYKNKGSLVTMLEEQED